MQLQPLILCTCADSEAGLLAHVAQADRDAVSTARLQPFQQVLHCVVLCGQLVVPFHLTDHVPHVDCICLKTQSRPERVRTGEKKRRDAWFVWFVLGDIAATKSSSHIQERHDAVSYQRGLWRVVGWLPLQQGLRFVTPHPVEVPGWQPLIGNHFHHPEVRGRAQEGRNGSHLKADHDQHVSLFM